MKNICLHTNTAIIVDKNHDEHLPVKSMKICLDCNDEVPNEELLIPKTAEYHKWKRENDIPDIPESVSIQQPPYYIRKTNGKKN